MGPGVWGQVCGRWHARLSLQLGLHAKYPTGTPLITEPHLALACVCMSMCVHAHVLACAFICIRIDVQGLRV